VKAILGQQDIKTSMVYIHDVEDDISQETSPLQLLSEDVFGTSEFQVENPLQIKDGKEPAIDDQSIYSSYYDLFPDPGANIKIRPQLNSADLDSLRKVFVHYCETTEYHTTVSDIKALYNRILRKSKGKKS
ncbi:hypothetical protein ACFLVW_07530, partial [Chloroflexota bacterium]